MIHNGMALCVGAVCVCAGLSVVGPVGELSHDDGCTSVVDAGGALHNTLAQSARNEGDLDGDGDVDISDYAVFASCLTGPDQFLLPGCMDADFTGDFDVDQEDFAVFQVLYGSYPHIGGYSDSGCKDQEARGGTRDPYPWCGDDAFQLTVDGGTLHIVHEDATYNCCPDEIAVSLHVEGNVLRLYEEEILTTPCDCMCCFDVESSVINLAPGEYTVEYYWLDYEMGGEQCYVEDIVILEPPRVGSYGNSGCLEMRGSEGTRDSYPCPADDEVAFSVEPNTLHVLHSNATYNCCPADISVSLIVEGNVLRLTEEEILIYPCTCICCYEVDATVVNLQPGEYTVEYCWYDYEIGEEICYIEVVEVP